MTTHKIKTKSYLRSGISNNDVWLAYKVDNEYSGDSGYIDDDRVLLVKEEVPPDLNILSDYEFIEHIEGVNRTGKAARHKANVYSIRIRNSNLNEAIIDEEKRKRVQDSINTVIREAITKISPVNTQLWKIDWQGN
jgi:hypothetical protein